MDFQKPTSAGAAVLSAGPGYLGLFLAILMALVVGADRAAAEPAGPRWPLDLPTRYLTSNFMEFRDGRFHAGLDFKTRSMIGFPVFAVEDGWISRVRASAGAYGRAVYLQGESGRTYVYGHLARFSDKIRIHTDAARSETGRYRVQVYFSSGELRVRRGDVLGLSGQAGTNGPHLHFEVRDRQQRPLNPVLQGFAVPDTFAPVIHQVRVLPVRRDSRIEGANVAHLLGGSGGLQGRQPPVHVSGPVAFSAKIVDRADIRGHRLEPLLIEVRLDDQVVYRCRNENFAFTDNSLQRLEWLRLPARDGRPAIREHWLHRRPGMNLEGREGGLWYLGTAGEGLPEGRHVVDIRAVDEAGNTTRCGFDIVVGNITTKDVGPAWKPAPAQLEMDSGSATARLTPFFVDLPDSADGFQACVLDPAAGDPVLATTTLVIRSTSADATQLERAAAQGLVPAGPVAEYLAADLPLEAAVPVDLTAAVDTTGGRTGVYRWHRDAWKSAAGLMAPDKADGPWRFGLVDPGLYAVLRDAAPPRLFLPEERRTLAERADRDSHGVTLPRWHAVAVALMDDGSGVAAETIVVTLDGRPLIAEPDLPRDRILVTPPDDLAPGRYELTVAVADEVGNPSRWSCQLELSAASDGP